MIEFQKIMSVQMNVCFNAYHVLMLELILVHAWYSIPLVQRMNRDFIEIISSSFHFVFNFIIFVIFTIGRVGEYQYKVMRQQLLVTAKGVFTVGMLCVFGMDEVGSLYSNVN